MEYPCAHEQVEAGRTGLLFSDASELADQWVRLFGKAGPGSALPPSTVARNGSAASSDSHGSACHNAELEQLQRELAGSRLAWEDQWSRVMPTWLQACLGKQL